MQTCLLRLETQQRQGTVPPPSQAKQCIDHGGRNDRNRWFAASRGLFRARNDVNVDSNRCVDHVRWSVAVEVVLLRMATPESYRPFRHQLRYAEAHPSLKLALDRQRIHGRTAVERDRYTMDFWPPILD